MNATAAPDPTHNPVARVISWCLDHRMLVIVATLLVGFAGVVAMQHTALDAIPDLSDTQVIVFSEWMGRDPQTVEDQITYPLSTAMLAVPNVRTVRGYSFFGESFVYVIFEDGTDIYWARSRVLEYLNQVRGQIPADATPTLGPDATGVGWVFAYTLEDKSGTYNLGDLRALQDWYVRYQLTSVRGVAEVASIGGYVRQYQITVDPSLLQAYDISLPDVAMAVKKSNNDVGGRLLEIAETEYMVRGRGYLRGVEDIENVVVKADKGHTPVLLKNIAQVQIGPDIRRGIAEKNGEGETVGGIVVMRDGQNALSVIRDVKQKIRDISSGLPAGVEIKPAYDRSGLILRSIDTLRRELIQQMVIVALTCILFLWHARSALVAAVSLPLGILVSFVVMRLIGVNANVMSLGGIAIAIGAMVDAAVVLVENAHKKLEMTEKPSNDERWRIVREAAMEVGPSLFFSLLVVTVSFLPVFALQGQAGRLFRPLAFTKTFAMAAAAVIAITITPVLMGFFIRGKIHHESKLPISRAAVAMYRPVIRGVLRHPVAVIVGAVLITVVTIIPFSRLGSEFMPPLNEGDILYMPTSLPGLSETEARRVLQTQDKLFRTFPEVGTVFGKIGGAQTATDPAPMMMVETTVNLHDPHTWPKRWIDYGVVAKRARTVLEDLQHDGYLAADAGFDPYEASGEIERMVRRSVNGELRGLAVSGLSDAQLSTAAQVAIPRELSARLGELIVTRGVAAEQKRAGLDDAIRAAVERRASGNVKLHRLSMDELMYEDMDKEFQFVGMTNAWTMPIKTRIDMLATGIKTPVGIKIFGDDLATLQDLAVKVEGAVKRVPGTLSAIGERSMGGKYIDFDIDRIEAARHGLTVGDVQEVIETAVGGMNITQTVEGRYRFPVNVRYPRELRDDPRKLGRVLVSSPTGEQVPIDQLATIALVPGPPEIKSENGLLQAIVYVDLQKGQDVGSFVARAKAAVDRDVPMPPGYYMAWSGQFEQMLSVRSRMRMLVPLALLLIFLLLYFNFGRLQETLIVMLSLPFALVGGVWLMAMLGYNTSVGTAVGFIALSGLAVETGVVMLLFLNLSFNEELQRGGAIGRERLDDAIIHGAVMRVRPKLMTVGTTIMGLLPIMWMTGAGSSVMKRMAAPMIGGLVSSTLLTLIVIPAIYALLRRREMAKLKSP
ncbi:MAG TPA: CusA/CzcA family heavy metal efflux RND transporter [Candidatus Krumholzibacteria bacterium]|nr:CusA/CzcA family heavy metal efflux RND transporter [Candidatus Krumholzibacteria bacterium]